MGVSPQYSPYTFSFACNCDCIRVCGGINQWFPKYALDDNRIGVTFEVRNTGDTAMPFFVGGHPGFNVPLFPGERFDDYFIEFEQRETISVPYMQADAGLVDYSQMTSFLQNEDVLKLSHNMFRSGALQLEGLKSRCIILRSQTNSHSIKMEYSDFPVLLIWSSANDGPFVDLEPWIGSTSATQDDDVIDHKRYIQYAASGGSKSYQFSLTIS